MNVSTSTFDTVALLVKRVIDTRFVPSECERLIDPSFNEHSGNGY